MSELEKMVRNLLDEYMEMKIMYLISQKKAEQVEQKMEILEKVLKIPGTYHKSPADLDKIEITVTTNSKFLELVVPEEGRPRFQKWNPKK